MIQRSPGAGSRNAHPSKIAKDGAPGVPEDEVVGMASKSNPMVALRECRDFVTPRLLRSASFAPSGAYICPTHHEPWISHSVLAPIGLGQPHPSIIVAMKTLIAAVRCVIGLFRDTDLEARPRSFSPACYAHLQVSGRCRQHRPQLGFPEKML